MVTFTLPVESGVCFVPFTVILLTVPAQMCIRDSDEVEHAANVVEGVAESCVIYNKAKEVLILFYTGDCDRRSLALALCRKVSARCV